MTRYRIGVDDTGASDTAVAWIAANVRPQADSVDVVVIGEHRRRADTVGRAWSTPHEVGEQLRRQHPALLVTDGSATARSGDVAAADVFVIGITRASPFGRALMGWVPERVMSNSGIPVVAVPAPWRREGKVIVGVDPDTSEAALPFAASRALSTDSELTIVRAWQVPNTSTPFGQAPVEEDRSLWCSRAEELVASSASLVHARFPKVRARTVVREGRAGDVLAGLSRSASLVVIGRRHHTVLGGALFGSVGLQLLHDAEVPVATVPSQGVYRRGEGQILVERQLQQEMLSAAGAARAAGGVL